MTREELLELAALDAFGMLDDYEAALFTRSFHHAPAPVQDEIKEIQASFAGDPALLPDVEPTAEQRGRVLAAVARAIESESVELAPLAMIGGSPRNRGTRATRQASVLSSPFWRAAAFILAAGNLVFAYFCVQLYQDQVQLAEAIIERDTIDGAKALIGGDFYEDFVGNPNCKVVVLSPIGGRPISATVYLKPVTTASGEAEYALFLKTEGLPETTPFTLTARQGTEVELTHQFTTAVAAISGKRIDEVVAVVGLAATRMTWEITDATGTVLLSFNA
jgi:hypothetical protein